MHIQRTSKLSAMVALAVLALGGCRAEEQGRLINYQPGVYKGKPDTQLTEKQRRTLRQRTVFQGSGIAGGGGAVPAKLRDVRKPAGGVLDLKTLRKRSKKQAGSSTRL